MLLREHPAMVIDGFVPQAGYVNAHVVGTAASPDAVWSVLPETAFTGGRPRAASVLLALAAVARLQRPGRMPARIPIEPGEGVVVGDASFTVAHADPGVELVLTGRHRYATYAANFYLEPHDDGTRIYQVTRATFLRTPIARLYFAGVRVFHDALVESMLRRIARRAEAQEAGA